MNDTSIEKFDPSKLMDGVRDRIKATFIALIPDTQWDEMVKKVVDEFFETKEKRTKYYDRREQKISDFETIVFEELDAITRVKVRAELDKYIGNTWDGNNNVVVSKELEKLIIKRTPEIITSALGQMMNGVINNMRMQ